MVILTILRIFFLQSNISRTINENLFAHLVRKRLSSTSSYIKMRTEELAIKRQIQYLWSQCP